MTTFTPLTGFLSRISCANVSAAVPPLPSVIPGPGTSNDAPSTFALQRPRASLASSLVFAVSLSLFGAAGCGRTGLLGPEEDTIADAGTEPHDAGSGGNRFDAGVADGGMDAGTVRPNYVSDLDCDDVPDLWDNCPLSPNTNQMDSDGDGIGDVCDNDSVNPDTDADGILDGIELFQLGTDVTKSDTDGDGIADGVDTCPLTAGPAGSQGCQPSAPTCAIEAVPLPFTLCDGTMVNGFRILWNAGNAQTASLKEGSNELTRKHSGQVYVYPSDTRSFEIRAASPFGNCNEAVTVTP